MSTAPPSSESTAPVTVYVQTNNVGLTSTKTFTMTVTADEFPSFSMTAKGLIKR